MKVFLVVPLLLSLGLSASATVITFEDLSGSGALPVNYAGLTWSDGWYYYDWAQDPYNPSSGVVRVYDNDGSPPPRFSFPGTVTFQGAYFAGGSSAAYDLYLGGILVASSPTITLSAVPTFVASGYGGQVDEVRLKVSQGAFVMDDVTYNELDSTTPEPGTVALLGIGLMGLAALRRRRR